MHSANARSANILRFLPGPDATKGRPSERVRSALVENLRAFNAQVPSSRHIIFKPDPNGIDCYGWVFSTLLAFRGQAHVHIAAPLLVIMAEAVALAILGDSHIMGEYALTIPASTFQDGFRLLGVPVAFLLVFRLNRAAVRYYHARAAFGKLIECSRTLAGQAVHYLSHDPKYRDDVCRWVVVLPFASRNYLRGGGPDVREELSALLTREEAEALNAAKMQPLLCVDRMRAAVWAGVRSNPDLPAVLVAQTLNNMEGMITLLTGAVGAMERINSTPLPIAWVAHLRQFLMCYLLGVPFSLVSTCGWGAPLVTFVVALAMLGLEAAAVVSERPFSNHPSHLPITAFCKTIAENVEQILTQPAYPAAPMDLNFAGGE